MLHAAIAVYNPTPNPGILLSLFASSGEPEPEPVPELYADCATCYQLR